MTVEDLIKELQKLDPRAEVIIEDFDNNFRYKIYKVDYTDGNCNIIIDEDYKKIY